MRLTLPHILNQHHKPILNLDVDLTVALGRLVLPQDSDQFGAVYLVLLLSLIAHCLAFLGSSNSKTGVAVQRQFGREAFPGTPSLGGRSQR